MKIYDEPPIPPSAAIPGPILANDVASPEIVRALRESPLLRDLTGSVLTRLAAISTIVDAPAETVICRQGDEAGELHLVLDGQLAGFSTAANGTTAIVEVIRTGETLGLATVLARLPRLLGVRTVTP